MVRVDSVSSEGPLLVCKHVSLHAGGRESISLVCLLIRAPIPQDPQTAPTNTITLGIRALTYEFWRNTNIRHSALKTRLLSVMNNVFP